MMHTIGTHTFDVRHGNVIRIKDQKKKITCLKLSPVSDITELEPEIY